MLDLGCLIKPPKKIIYSLNQKVIFMVVLESSSSMLYPSSLKATLAMLD